MLLFSSLVPTHPVHTPKTLQSRGKTVTLQDVGGARMGCTSVSPMAEDSWCAEMCAKPTPNCPEDLCECPDVQPGMSDLAVRGANGKPIHPPHPRIVGGWTNCAETAANGQVENESEDFLVDSGHKLCHAEEEGGDADAANQLGPNKGNMPPATSEWGPSAKLSWGANAVLPGKFGDDDISPTDQSGEYLYKWVTFGGQNSRFMDVSAGNGNWADGWEETAEQDIIDAGATGCAFDEEGGVDMEDIMGKTARFIKEMRKKHPKWTFLYVPTCGGKINKYQPEDGGPDYIAPMMYNTNHNSYPAMDLSVKPAANFIVDCITMVHRAGWPAARTILTYQSFDAYRTRESSNLPFLLGQLLGNHTLTLPRGEVLRGPYAGVLGWPAQCGAGDGRCWPEVDRINTEQVRLGMKHSNQYQEEETPADEQLSPEDMQKKAAQQEMARWGNTADEKEEEPKEDSKEEEEAAPAPKKQQQQQAKQEDAPEQEAATVPGAPVAPKPVAVAPTPVAVAPSPVAEAPTPVAEAPKAVAVAPEPVAVAPTPVPVPVVPVATSIPVPKAPVPAAPKEEQVKEEQEAPKEEQEAPKEEQEAPKEEQEGSNEEQEGPKEEEKSEAQKPLDHADAEQKVKDDIEKRAAEDAAKEKEIAAAEKEEKEKKAKEEKKKEEESGGWLENANKAAAEAAEAAKKALEDASAARTEGFSDAMKEEEEKHAAAARNGEAPGTGEKTEQEDEEVPQQQEEEQKEPEKAPDAAAMDAALGDANTAAADAAAAAKKALDEAAEAAAKNAEDAAARAKEARDKRAAEQREADEKKREEQEAQKEAQAAPQDEVAPLEDQEAPTAVVPPEQEEAAPQQEQEGPTEEVSPQQEEAAPQQEQAPPQQEQAAPQQEQAAPQQEQAAPPQQEQVAPARTIRMSAYDPHRYEGDRPQGAQHNHGGKA